MNSSISLRKMMTTRALVEQLPGEDTSKVGPRMNVTAVTGEIRANGLCFN
jgi:hypothetical protein